VEQKSLSHHLHPMRAAGVIFCQRIGRQQHYQLSAGRVVFERHPTGGFSLTVNAREGGVAVTITVGRPSSKDSAG
jgi:hypothetical protein